jgi:predicted amidophosphoribosyltransferase
MPSVVELSAPYANFMLGPRRGPGVCSRCFDLISGPGRCYHCAQHARWVDVAAPVSYSIGGEQLHHALTTYKRLTGEPGRYFLVGLAAVLWRHLDEHEGCLARAAGVNRFDVVTTVPSSDPDRWEAQALQQLVGTLVRPVRERYERLLVRTSAAVAPHRFNLNKYEAIRAVGGRSVLLIDDTWTTGANAQSAAAVLKAAGAGPIAALVIGRYVNRGYGDNDRQLHSLPAFDWHTCPWCWTTSQGGRREDDR